ncbi:restriction endonuclease fold toxin 5 domain-containing protein [Herbaspirillum huttiense]|uniref:restriction endonuclease fold toxin 5 domain-containing protein n=1 Tax=Herbaspirillum huttiense TaxID=863372 RepID=UPI003877C84D
MIAPVVAVPLLSSEILGWIGLGASAAAAGAGAAIYSSSRRAEEAKSSPLSQADVLKKDQSCKRCPPAAGSLVPRNWHMSEEARAYQARVTGFAPYTEWAFDDIDFDGFQPAPCLLQEAKARYAQFFDKKTSRPKSFYVNKGYQNLLRQAKAQSGTVLKSPPARLHWYVQDEPVFRHLREVFILNRFPIHIVHLP